MNNFENYLINRKGLPRGSLRNSDLFIQSNSLAGSTATADQTMAVANNSISGNKTPTVDTVVTPKLYEFGSTKQVSVTPSKLSKGVSVMNIDGPSEQGENHIVITHPSMNTTKEKVITGAKVVEKMLVAEPQTLSLRADSSAKIVNNEVDSNYGIMK